MFLAFPNVVLAFWISLRGKSRWWLSLCIPLALVSGAIDIIAASYQVDLTLRALFDPSAIFVVWLLHFAQLVVYTLLFRWHRSIVERRTKSVD